MTRLHRANLLAVLVVLLSFMATVSYAGNKPDTPVPKENTGISTDKKMNVSVVTVSNIEVRCDLAVIDIGSAVTLKTDAPTEADVTDITPFIKRPERPSATHYGYLKRSWKKVYANKIRPPNRTE